MKIGHLLSLIAITTIMATSMASAKTYKDVHYSESYKNPYMVTNPRYDYIYANPPRTSLQMRGRFVLSTGGTRYVHSPSRLKGMRHAARVNASNRLVSGY